MSIPGDRGFDPTESWAEEAWAGTTSGVVFLMCNTGGCVAQLVERRIADPQVAGSNPVVPSLFVSGLRRIEILPSGPRATLSGALVEVFN